MTAVARTGKLKTKEWAAELYLIGSVLFYWLSTQSLFNPVAIVLLAVLIVLVWRKSPMLGWVVGLLFLLLNLYMVLALIDEFAEFERFNSGALQLIVGGSLYLGLNIFTSILLLVKWGKKLGSSSRN